jgi:phosphoribosyl-ATP pyrophosphohydrolase
MKSFDQLWEQLVKTSQERPSGSRTVSELDSGVHEIGKKIIEEAGEVWLAAEHESNEELAKEISQLLYHLQVLMLSRGLSLDDIYKEL